MAPYSTGRWGKEKLSAAWIKIYYKWVNRVMIPPVSKTHALSLQIYKSQINFVCIAETRPDNFKEVFGSYRIPQDCHILFCMTAVLVTGRINSHQHKTTPGKVSLSHTCHVLQHKVTTSLSLYLVSRKFFLCFIPP